MQCILNREHAVKAEEELKVEINRSKHVCEVHILKVELVLTTTTILWIPSP
jgi:hypothetical protein